MSDAVGATQHGEADAIGYATSRDGMDFFIYLPMSPARPRVLAWQEVAP